MFVVGKKKRNEFSASQHAEIAAIIAASTCKVMCFRRLEGLVGVHIEFAGQLAHFPSTSNDKEIGFRYAKGKSGFMRRPLPYIRKSTSAQIRLRAATHAFTTALVNSGHRLPTFEKEPVRVLGLFASKPGRWDVHNMDKPLGDWLQEIGIIDDDSRATIWCEKKENFGKKYHDPNVTTIIIQPEHQVNSLIHETIQEMRQCSTGALKLVG